MSAQDGLLRGRYQLLEVIGKGANAVVYKAVDTKDAGKKIVAIKKVVDATHKDKMLLNDGNAGPSDGESHWRREAELLRSLDHPNIVKYLDDFVDQVDSHSMYIVMEYASKGSLLTYLRKHPLSEESAAKYIYQIICGLTYLHHRRVIHRDVKAANVLLGDNGVAKLTDFGLATPKEATGQKNEHLTMLVGSVYWMSPESISLGVQSEASDIWSLGCTAVELVTGVPPFFDRAPVNALYHIVESTESPVPQNVSEGLREFLSMCLKRDPLQRPKAAALLQHEWFRRCGVAPSPPSPPKASHAPGEDSHAEVAPSSVSGDSVSPVADASASSSVASEVEAYLFGEFAERRDGWLEGGGLQRAVQALTTITAEDAYRVLRSLAFASQRSVAESPRFFVALGNTSLWALDLSVLGTMDNVATLFCDCCDYQSPDVTFYAPSQATALRLMLRHPDVGPQCITALHRLLVARYNVSDANTSTPVAVVSSQTAASSNEDESRSRSATAQARNSSVYQPPTVASAAARLRFVRDDAPSLIRDLLQDVCLLAFREKAEPPMKWEGVDKLFEILLSLMEDRTANSSASEGPIMGENWLIAVQEACSHHSRNALRLLVASISSPGRIMSGERVIVGRLIAAASDPNLDFESRLVVAQSFPRLQRHYPEAATALRDLNGNVPLLTHIVRHVPRTSAGADVDPMLTVFVELCENSDMAAACAAYDGSLSLLIQKITEARQRKAPDCLDRALKLGELLFMSATHPEWFVTSKQLTKLLVDVISQKKRVVAEWSVAQALAQESALQRAERLLNALAAQSISI